MVYILITFGDRCRKIAKPATYKDLIAKARKEFPMMSSVACLVVMYYPRTADETALLVKMVELDPSAYGAVKDGEVLFFNVQHPITKEYILPYPDEDPNVPRQSQHHPADVERMFARSGGDFNLKDNVSHQSFRQRAHVYDDTNAFSPEAPHPGGDAFGSGWGAASDRFWRSSKLVPTLKECKDGIGLAVGESNCYPDEQSADDRNDDFQLQVGAMKPVESAMGRELDRVLEGLRAHRQRTQPAETAPAGGADWGNSGPGTGIDVWGLISASDRHDTRPASFRAVEMGPNSTSSGETTQFPGHDDPFRAHPAQPNWLTPAHNAPATSNNTTNLQSGEAAQQTASIGPGRRGGGPSRLVAAHATGAQSRNAPNNIPGPRRSESEQMYPFNYGRPCGESFLELIAPGAVGPTHLIPLDLRENEARCRQIRQAREHSGTVRGSSPIPEGHSSFFDPARSTRGSPVRKQWKPQSNASSQWATKETRPKADREDALEPVSLKRAE